MVMWKPKVSVLTRYEALCEIFLLGKVEELRRMYRLFKSEISKFS